MDLITLSNIVECTIVYRESLFTVVVSIGNEVKKAHLINTGRLKDYLASGKKGFCIPIARTRSGLEYRLVGVEDNGYAAIVDTKLHEKSFEVLLSKNIVPWLENCVLTRRNVFVYNSRIDYEARCKDKKVLIEIKSAVMRFQNGFAGYPDAPTQRGKKHLDSLAKYVSNNMGLAYIVFVAAIPHAKGFSLYCDADKSICKHVLNALRSGVQFKSINIYLDVEKKGIVYGDLDLPIDLSCCETNI
ncbi:DNA/RNA nuclease SfsA [Ignisphaera sp. 4213-co]|uniref:DNA/RNA nuclease SfsA n=1 Tax=Ignisphaera cupida TaxID=3050454 RepID=A0ABD4Z678_9CREN|nr:DNA/RNA nuclease SfsA [Ignisphaera sp. 4213-co]MDK6028822.1 DNA/RNA nuclease SfsA [Ignisphaera sp. 4213-co]